MTWLKSKIHHGGKCNAMASYYMINIVFSHAFFISTVYACFHTYTAGNSSITDVSRSSTGISSNQPRCISTPASNRILHSRIKLLLTCDVLHATLSRPIPSDQNYSTKRSDIKSCNQRTSRSDYTKS